MKSYLEIIGILIVGCVAFLLLVMWTAKVWAADLYIDNAVDQPKPLYILSKVEAIPNGQTLAITADTIQKYGDNIAPNLYELKFLCYYNGSVAFPILVIFDIVKGIQGVENDCIFYNHDKVTGKLSKALVYKFDWAGDPKQSILHLVPYSANKN